MRWSLDLSRASRLFSDYLLDLVAVHTYGNVPLILSALVLLLLVGYLTLYVGTFTFLARFLQVHFGFQIIILCPFLWVSLEYLRSFFLTGFPWAILGYSQHLNLPFIQSADVLGAYGLSFALVLVNVTLYLIIRQWPTRNFPYRALIVTVIILLGFFIYGYVRISSVERQAAQQPPLKIGLVQGNIDQSMKWDESFRRETMEIYERLTLKVAQEKPDLILWPETATPFFFQDAKEYQPLVLDIPLNTKAFLLFGSPSYKIEKGKANHYNSAYLASPSGQIVGKYDKIHLVPFGEYIPLSDLLSFIGSLGKGSEILNRGVRFSTFLFLKGNLAPSSVSRSSSRTSAGGLSNRERTSSSPSRMTRGLAKTSAPYQHFSIAVFRAIENRVFVARAANTGLTGLIGPTGKILKQGAIFKEETMTGIIRLMKREDILYAVRGCFCLDLFGILDSSPFYCNPP